MLKTGCTLSGEAGPPSVTLLELIVLAGSALRSIRRGQVGACLNIDGDLLTACSANGHREAVPNCVEVC